MSAIGKCPWPGCGGEGKAPDILGFFNVQCQKCGACGPVSPREDGAIDAWNRLATPDPAEVRGRIRWEEDAAFVGPFMFGRIFPTTRGTWLLCLPDEVPIEHTDKASARAALVAAVREAIGDE